MYQRQIAVGERMYVPQGVGMSGVVADVGNFSISLRIVNRIRTVVLRSVKFHRQDHFVIADIQQRNVAEIWTAVHIHVLMVLVIYLELTVL